MYGLLVCVYVANGRTQIASTYKQLLLWVRLTVFCCEKTIENPRLAQLWY